MKVRTLFFYVAGLIFTFFIANSQLAAQSPFGSYEDQDGSCTSITVGKDASVDGSVMTNHTCDGNYRTWLNIVPHKKHDTGTKKKIFWGLLHTESPWDMNGVSEKGEIPQVEETYAFLNVAYPCLNEKQLAIGETTIEGRDELYNDEGLFLIENLEEIILERCTNAREAIKLIGDLVKEYGYGDDGECITIADPKEVWQLEIFGAGPIEIGAVWAAQRIPDDHVGVSANIPRISKINLKDTDHFMASENVYSLAEEMEWWKPGEEFKFWKAYSGKKPFSMREYFVLSTVAPSLNLQEDAEELPFSVKPDKKLSVRDVIKLYRETYEGTKWSLTDNLFVPKDRKKGEEDGEVEMEKSNLANPYMTKDFVNLLNALKPGTVDRVRQVAVARCSYSQVIQLRNWLPDEIGGVAYFSFDNPGQSPRFPIYAGNLELPNSFNFCNQHRFRTDAASWWFRRTNRLATVSYGRTVEKMNKARDEFEEKLFMEQAFIEKKAKEMYKDDPMKAREFLTNYSNDFARATMVKWWELGDEFWTYFPRGF